MVSLVKSAVHLFIFQNNQLLMLKRKNTGYMDGYYSLVAGHLDGGETVIEAAIREAKEEIDIDINQEDVEVSQIMHRKSDDERIDFFVRINAWQGDIINNECDKCEELKWFDIGDLPDNIIPYVRKSIENNMKNNFFDSFGWVSK